MPEVHALVNFLLFVLWIHLLAAVAWIGGMLFLTLILVPVERGIEDQKLRYELISKVGNRFKYLGWACVVILIITGLLNTLQGITSWGELFITSYGKTLILKIFLVFIMIILSAFHDFYLGPQLVRNAIKERPEENMSLARVISTLARGNLLLGLIIFYLALSLGRGGLF